MCLILELDCLASESINPLHAERAESHASQIVIISGGSGAQALSRALVRFTAKSTHILPVFDDGGASGALRRVFDMPPPGDLRNRLVALADPSRDSYAALCELFEKRFPLNESQHVLRDELLRYVHSDHDAFQEIDTPIKNAIQRYLDRCVRALPDEFDLRGGNLGNFIFAGAYLQTRDLSATLAALSMLLQIRGQLVPVCVGHEYHLKAKFTDGTEIVGQSRITTEEHPPIDDVSIVRWREHRWQHVRPELHPTIGETIQRARLVTFAMGSFYTSIVPNLMIGDMGRHIRRSRCPKLFVANLMRDRETPTSTVSSMLREVHRYLRLSDDHAGDMTDYVQYVLVNTHGDDDPEGRIPVDLDAIRRLGVEPIVLSLEEPSRIGFHRADLVAERLLALT